MALNALLAGCGQMAATWVEALRDPLVADRVRLVGLVDPDPAAAGRLVAAKSLAGVEVFTDLSAALAGLRPDVVFDVAVPDVRARLVADCLAAGAHVLTEKPMALSLDDARAMIAAASRAGRIHAVAQNRRFKTGIRRAKAVIESGLIGEVTALHCDFFVGAHFGGFREVMDHVLLMDMAIHTFDAARCLTGAEALAVYCQETNPKGSWYASGAAANAIFEFQGGIAFTYRGSWCAEGANTAWDADWRIIGTKGTLLWDGDEGFAVKAVAGNEGFFRPLADVPVPEVPEPQKAMGHVSVIHDFLTAIDTGVPPETAGHHTIHSLAMVLAAIESARLQARVKVEV